MIRCGDPEVARGLGERLAHRGGVSSEIAQVGPVWLGARSDTDLGQPVTKGPLTLVADLQLFNAPELARELEGAGVVCETGLGRLLLAALETWGLDALERLNGAFALALHDARDDSVLLARDLAGARPLYHTRWHGGLVFASEYKAFLGLPGFVRRPNRAALQNLHTRKLMPATDTLLDTVHQLPAGCHARVSSDGNVKAVRYWDLSLDLRERPLREHCDDILESFLRAMERRTRGTDPIGLSLSGGVDSMAMLAAARRANPERRICTFSAGDAPGDPEIDWAARAAKHFGSEHETLIVPAETLRTDLPHLVWHLEDPIARTETLLYYRTALEAQRKQVRVLLAGHGADGALGGMARHQILALAGRVPLGRGTLGEIYSFTQTGVAPRGVLARLLTSLVLRNQIPPAPQVLGAPPPAALAALPRAGPEILNEVCRMATLTGLPLWLPKVERAHVAARVSFASPFVDPEFLRAAFRVPSRYKHTLRQDKMVFRQAIAGLLPEGFRHRPKFAQRIRETLRFCEVLEEVARPLLSRARVAQRGLLDPDDVARLLERPRHGAWPPEHAMRIWTLVLGELWAEIFLDGDGRYPTP